MSHITGVATNLFCARFYRHMVNTNVSCGKLLSGCCCWALAPFAVCFAVFWMAMRKSGRGTCVSLLFGVLWVLFVFDLPHCMWPIVSMWNFLFYRFFSCKDRALVRDRPYQRKKKVDCWLFCVGGCGLLVVLVAGCLFSCWLLWLLVVASCLLFLVGCWFVGCWLFLLCWLLVWFVLVVG